MSDHTGPADVTNAEGKAHDVAPAKCTSLTTALVTHRTWSNGLPIVKVMLARHLDDAA